MKTIFVADDSPVVQCVLAKALQGYRVVSFPDGLACYQEVLRNRPDVLVLDIIMPNLCGLSVANLLKIQEEYADLPILVVSSITEHDVERRAREAGADEFIAKPLPLDRVRAAVDALLVLGEAR